MDKLSALRTQMKAHGIDAYIVPSGDDHKTGYVAEYWTARKWLSGFTGSAGTAVVTHDRAGLWADGRYFIQAEDQLKGTDIDLYKMGMKDVPTVSEFLLDVLPDGGKLGFDGRSTAIGEFNALKNKLEPKNIAYMYTKDLVGEIWQNRPPLSGAPAFEHLPQFAGISAAEKLCKVREKMKEANVTTYLVTGLDEIAWLLNIRGTDTPNMPLVYSYLLITETEARIFVDAAKMVNIASKLEAQGFVIDSYEVVADKLKALPDKGSIYYNKATINVLLAEAIPQGQQIPPKVNNIIAHLKGVKSDTELANIKNAFIKEGVAMTKLFKWLHDTLQAAKPVTEDDIAKKLSELRKQQPNCLGDSFQTISAYGANAAMSHYKHEGSGATLAPGNFYLIDTGGQYLDGTTDTTRTMAVGNITEEMKKDFTLVLKGHIALSMAVFLQGTTGHALDMLARQPVLSDLQNYRHGTGHGIGYCLGVHEGPHGIANVQGEVPVELVPGMLASNEPGIYKQGRYGIRTETIIAVKEVCENEYGKFLNFETLTLCPYDKTSIDLTLLTQTEKDYLNNYHTTVYQVLAPLLTEDEAAWLKGATTPLL